MSNLQRRHVELKNIHKGEDIWIIASGPSMNFVSPDFFANKISIGVNRVNIKFHCDYLVAKDPSGLNELEGNQQEAKLILSKWAYGNPGSKLNSASKEHWIFDHPAKPAEKPDTSVIGTDFIVVSHSTITSAIHLAAYMGAKNIIICGHDCGAINGMVSIKDYYANSAPIQQTDAGYFKWLGHIEKHTVQVCGVLKSHYDVNIHSLNPFINLNLEGNHFEPAVTEVRVNGFESSNERVKANRFGSSAEQFKSRLKEIAQLQQASASREAKIALLKEVVADGQSEIVQLKQAVSDGESENAQLKQAVSDGESELAQLAELKNLIESYRNSWSWRITQPIRFLGKLLVRH